MNCRSPWKVGLCAILATACGEIQVKDLDALSGPKIDSLDVGDGILDVGLKRALTCNAVGDALTFSWATTLGTIVGTGASVMLDAGGTDGNANVTCFVNDGHGLAALAEKVVTISLPRTDLVAYYPFDGNGSEASGGGLDVLIPASSFVPDRLGGGQALRFVGGAAPIQLPASPAFNAGLSYTISLFVSSDDAASAHGVLGKGNASAGNYSLRTEPNRQGALDFEYVTSSGQVGFGVSNTPIGSVPTHIAIVFDDSTLTTYVDGQRAFHFESVPQALLNSAQVQLGAASSMFPTASWVGTIDEVRFYKRALTSLEVVAIAKSKLH
jgi:hypothetical protein